MLPLTRGNRKRGVRRRPGSGSGSAQRAPACGFSLNPDPAGRKIVSVGQWRRGPRRPAPGSKFVKRIELAIIGFGRLGRACAEAIRESVDLSIAGVVRRAENARRALPRPFEQVPVVAHVGDLPRLDAALVCVPTEHVLGVAQALLQRRVPIVECASLEGEAFARHRDEIDRLAENHRVAAWVGAGWNPGVLDRLASVFALLVPHGHTTLTPRPGASLHHTAAAARIPGVAGALSTEIRGANGTQRYVYVELVAGAVLAEVEAALRADPLFAGEQTLVFQVGSIAELEDARHGVLLERRGTSGSGVHDTLLLEARCDPARFSARLMLDAARMLPRRHAGARVYLPTMW